MIPYSKPWIDTHTRNALSNYVLGDGWLTEHTQTELFEDKVCDYVGCNYAHAVCNGTMGLVSALLACGVKAGDMVAVPEYTFVGTYNAVLMIGAYIKKIPVRKSTLCMEVEQLCFEDVDAVVYVTLNGRIPPSLEWLDIPLIVDACQSFGHKGIIGDADVYSFSPQKIITTGQGGMVITDDEKISNKILKLKNFGRRFEGTDVYDGIGYNFKFTDMQAVAGIAQMDTLDKRISKSRRLYQRYYDEFGGLELQDGQVPIAFEYFGKIKYFDAEVQLRKFYPNNAGIEGYWLPFYPQMTDDEFEKVVKWIKSQP